MEGLELSGAILGDIAGSRFEFSKPSGFNPKTEPLFTGLSRFTDDTVLTVATKYAVLSNRPFARAYGSFGRRYPKAGYGNMFRRWMMDHSEKGYQSYGNGAAMRVSFIGCYFDTLELVEREAERSARCTHDHVEGIRAAKATAAVVFLARMGASKAEICAYLKKKYHYPVRKPVWMYRPFSKFDATAQGSMPLAIRCFLESEDWESCIRKVFSVTCDTDTVCCIAGAMAYAMYQTTGYDEAALLKQYLVKPNEQGRFDSYLYDWAVKPMNKTEGKGTI